MRKLKELINAFSKGRMLAFYSLRRWKKSEYQEETTNHMPTLGIDKFEFRPDQTTDYGALGGLKKFP